MRRLVQPMLFLAVVLFGVSSLGLIQRQINLIAGANIGVSRVDNATTGQQDATISFTGAAGGVSSVNGTSGVSCSPTTGAVVCSATGSSVSSVNGSGLVSCSPTTGAVTCSATDPVGEAHGGTGVNLTAISVGSVFVQGGSSQFSALAAGTANNVLTDNGTIWTSAAPSFVKSGWTDGHVIGGVLLSVGGALQQVADQLSIAGIPAGANALIWYRSEVVAGPSVGSEVTFDARVDGSSVLTEQQVFAAVSHGLSFNGGGNWSGMWIATGLSSGTHTFDLFAQCPSGATGASNTQHAQIRALIVTL